MRHLSEQKRIVEQWRGMEKKNAEISELITLAEEEQDTSLQDGIEAEVSSLNALLEKLELELAFSGEYGRNGC